MFKVFYEMLMLCETCDTRVDLALWLGQRVSLHVVTIKSVLQMVSYTNTLLSEDKSKIIT